MLEASTSWRTVPVEINRGTVLPPFVTHDPEPLMPTLALTGASGQLGSLGLTARLDSGVAPAPRRAHAAAPAAALLDDGTDAPLYELAGNPVTLTELAAVLSAVTGYELAYRGVSLEEYRAGTLTAGRDEGTADFLTALEAGSANGELDGDSGGLEQLLGRPGIDRRTAITSLVGR
jgi:hypothetical protein